MQLLVGSGCTSVEVGMAVDEEEKDDDDCCVGSDEEAEGEEATAAPAWCVGARGSAAAEGVVETTASLP